MSFFTNLLRSSFSQSFKIHVLFAAIAVFVCIGVATSISAAPLSFIDSTTEFLGLQRPLAAAYGPGSLTYIAADYTVSTTGGVITVTDNSGNSDSLSIAEPSTGNIQFAATGRTFSVNGGAVINGDSGNLSLTGVNSITVNQGNGDDTANVSAFTPLMPSLTINGDAGNDTVNLNGDIAFAANGHLDVDLQNDTTPGIDTVNVAASANLTTSGTGKITVKVSKNVAMGSGSSFVTVNGNLVVEANQQGTPTTGDFVGINVNNGLIQATGTGAVTVRGKGGDTPGQQYGVQILAGGDIIGGTSGLVTVQGKGGSASGTAPSAANHGVYVQGANSTITSGGAGVSVSGTGGGVGGSGSNIGVNLAAGGQITAGSSATVTVEGQGGNLTGTGNSNWGVSVIGTSSKITSNDGNVSVTGTGGGAGSSGDNMGVRVEAAGQITAGGSGSTVTVEGNGGNLTGPGTSGTGNNYAVFISGANATITSTGGNVSVTGTGGGALSASSNHGVVVVNGGLTSAGGSGTVTIVGKGGNLTGTGGSNFGVEVAIAKITSSGGNVSVTGTGGGGAGSLGSNIGVHVDSIGQITAGGSGTVTVEGQGGSGPGGENYGVYVADESVTVTSITSTGGNVKVTGTGGGAGSSSTNYGVQVASAGKITAGGTGAVTVVGKGGNLAGTGAGSNHGVYVVSTSSKITSSGGNVSVTGTGGGAGDGSNLGVNVLAAGMITAGGSGTVTVAGYGGNLTGIGGSNFGVQVQGTNSTITSSGGAVSVTGAGGGAGSSASNYGVYVVNTGQITAGVSGTVTVAGNGGNLTGTGGSNYGVRVVDTVSGVSSTITSSGGNVSVTGTGGGAGSGGSNLGVDVEAGGQITASGSGAVTVMGNGGNLAGTTGGSNYGVYVSGTNSRIASSVGSVSVTGGGGGAGASANNMGVRLESGGQIFGADSSGTLSVVGKGGNGSGGTNHGVFASGTGSNYTIESNGGNLSVTGTEGAGTTSTAIVVADVAYIITDVGGAITLTGDSMDFGTSTTIYAQTVSSVTVRQRTSGVAINLGAASDTNGGPLSLSNLEFRRVQQAGTINVGNASGGSITVSASVNPSSPSTLNLISGANIDISGGSVDSLGGDVNVNLQPGTNVFPSNSGVDVIISAATTLGISSGKDLKIAINTTTVDSGYTQLKVNGLVKLTGVVLNLSGTHAPVAGQTFTIVNNDGTDAITGTFAGLPQGATIPNFLGSGLNAAITYVGGTGNNDVLLTVQTPPPTLGNYAAASVPLGKNTTLAPPSAPPSNTTGINVSTDSRFKGILTADLLTGVVRVTNADPRGTATPVGPYTVTVKAFGPGGSTTKTFTLTVTNGTACTGTIQFTNAANVSTGTSPYSVAIGDFNNDGNQDFATANIDANTVSIRLGDGSGGFSGTTDVSVGARPFSVAIGDFNNDGKQDFAAANANDNTVSIRIGDGLGGFSGTTNVSVSGASSVAIGDFNNDGNQDFAATGSTVSIRLGDGAGNFSGTTEVSGSGPSVAIGDFNNDGKQDFAATNGANGVSIRLGGCLDTTPPVTTITAPTGGSTTGGGGSVLFSANETSTYVCTLDGSTVACNAPSYSFNGLSTGSHTFTVRATDTAGNQETTTKSVTWTVDASGPVITIVNKPTDPTTSTSADFTFTAADSSTISSINCVLDGVNSACGSGTSGSKSYTGLSLGSHTFSVYGTDQFGNVGPSATYSWTIVCTTVVTTVADTGAGSLREAINCANTTSGTDTISFTISGSGVKTISPASSLPTITESVIIDGTTQTTFGGDANPAGPEVVINGSSASGSNGFTVSGGGSTIKGLVINGFNGSGIRLQSNGNTIQGNFIGSNLTGTTAVANGTGIRVANPSTANTIGGTTAAAGNLISGNFGDGITFMGATLIVANREEEESVNASAAPSAFAGPNTVQGNRIGTQADGTTALGNGLSGVSIQQPTGTTFRPHSDVNGPAAGISPDTTLIGGQNAGAGNVIAYNGRDGIQVTSVNLMLRPEATDTSIGNHISGNSIFSNGSATGDLGIDLNNDGVTANDPQDGDSGPNNLQNFPVITSATVGGATRTITGTLNTTPNSSPSVYTVEFFSNSACDTSGNGEGQTYLGTITTSTTNASGDVTPFTFNPATLTIGQLITATATDSNGNTSEFSLCRQAQNANTPPMIAAVGVTRQAGSPSTNSTIANVTDAESGNGGVTVTVNGSASATVNGVTVSNIVNTTGTVTANVVAACGATNASFTLTATDGGGATATAMLNVTVNANTAPTLTYNNPAAIVYGSGTTVNRATGPSDNGSVASIALQSAGTYTGSISVNNSTGVVTITNAQPVGTHTITVRSTDNCGATTDSTFQLTVNKANTTTSLVSSLNPSIYGQSVTFTATVAAVTPGAGTPSGTATFFDDATPICLNVVLNGSSQATCSTSALSIGSHSITVQYSGDGNFNGSTSAMLTQVVNKANTTTTVTSSQNPSTFGQSVTFTATVAPVAPGAGTPTGTATFFDGATPICSNVALNGSSQATCSTSALASGSHSITVQYSGDDNFNGSTSAVLTQVVNKANTTTTITNGAALANQSNVGQSYPVNWSVTVNSPGAGTPTGTVTVSDGTGTTCSAPVAAGTCDLTSTSVGVKTITATYNGDANFNASTSQGVSHTVVLTISGNIKQFVWGGPNTNLSGVSVTLSGCTGGASQSTTTDAGGNYSFTGQYTGTCTITPTMTGKVFDPTTRTYTNVTTNISGADFIAYNTPGPVPRQVIAVTQYVTPGQIATMPLILSSLGTEVFNSFSLSYDTNLISGLPTVACGAAAPGCAITLDNSIPGKIGITIVPTSGYAAGDREIARVTFQTLPTNQPNMAVTFGGTPVGLLAKDASNNPLPVTYVNGFVVFSQGIEGDITNRNMGNGSVDSTDVALLRQFVVGNLTSNPAFNEFQRADVSPAFVEGDGQLDATDLVQERKYAVGTDIFQAAGGPFTALAIPIGQMRPLGREGAREMPRTMRITSVSTSNGNRVTIPVELTTQGGETAASFTLNFDPAKLRNPSIELGTGANADTVLTANTANAGDGRVTVLVDSSSTLAKQLINVTFDVAATAASGETRISFANDPTPSVISDANGSKLDTSYENGTVTITGPNSTGLTISGRVLTADGRGLRNARVIITDADGLTRTVATSAFGFYSFDGVTAGGTYTIGIVSRAYRFVARTVTVTDNLTDVDFSGQE